MSDAKKSGQSFMPAVGIMTFDGVPYVTVSIGPVCSPISPEIARHVARVLLDTAALADRAASSPPRADTAGPAAAADGGAGDSHRQEG